MKPLKVIAIDDDPSALGIIHRLLSKRGYSVQTYADPVESPLYQGKTCPCSLRDSGCPDLIISDFNMPAVNGVELLEHQMGKGCRCRHLALVSGAVIPETDLSRVAKYGTRYFAKTPDWSRFHDWLDVVEREFTERS